MIRCPMAKYSVKNYLLSSCMILMPCCRWPGKVQMRLTFTNPSETKTFHATRNQNQICSNALKNTYLNIPKCTKVYIKLHYDSTKHEELCMRGNLLKFKF